MANLSNEVFSSTLTSAQSFTAGSFQFNIGGSLIKQRTDFVEFFKGGAFFKYPALHQLQLFLNFSPDPFPPAGTSYNVSLLKGTSPVLLASGEIAAGTSPSTISLNLPVNVTTAFTGKIRITTGFPGDLAAGSFFKVYLND